MGYSPRVAVGSPEPGDRADRSLTGALAGKHWRFTLWSVPVSRPPPCGGSHAGRRAASRLGRHGGGVGGGGRTPARAAHPPPPGGGPGGRTLRRDAAPPPPARRCTSEPAPAAGPRGPAHPAAAPGAGRWAVRRVLDPRRRAARLPGGAAPRAGGRAAGAA